MQEFWTDLLNGELYAVLSACIAYVLLMGMVSITTCFRIRRWPQTIGKLTEDGVSSIGSYDERMHTARVRYEYSVDDTPYTGERLSPFILRATGTTMAKWQKKGIQRHEGDHVTVFYNPALPRKSYLIVPTLTGIGGIFLLVAIVVIVFWFAM
ncbi:hypothetical protein WH96_18735 [Kiloniella spongiae]|uniref:DUF3592 domain-containing protein n=1 Tax=Kiloniella spongiae TaxID=1489064 RepID=A0A0H2MR69_9PROT|nr:DUF3592 domain-containing protein [Kiloniella spongiae]KLN59185.1 hypothetical protein WH96_18735 [Kiloniella spongiae]